ncbi:RNA polymerase sigma factor [Aquihabitans daechungensis]|uniref:RNA polymerase sigma factor n=1 Tax=Aquihabitans daechungensis TaxID=1052257 RepID=UPI003B9FF6B9
MASVSRSWDEGDHPEAGARPTVPASTRTDEPTRGLRDFDVFTATAGKHLQQALVAAYGPEDGADIYADAMLRAWSDWEHVGRMENPAGYLWRVAQSSHRRYRRWHRKPRFATRAVLDRSDLTDRDLFLSLGSLSDAERVAVVMVHAHRATYQEVADLLEVPVTTVNNLVHRGLNRLRTALGEA